MAKKSLITRQRKRQRNTDKYAKQRAALKAAGDYQGLQRLPRDASPTRPANRCSVNGRKHVTSVSLVQL